MTMEKNRKADGFRDQYLFVLPKRHIVDYFSAFSREIFCVSDIGFFPQAKHHYRQRQAGIKEEILLVCVQGKGYFQGRSGTKETISTGDVIYIPAGYPHMYEADFSDPWSIYWFHLHIRVDAEVGSGLQEIAPVGKISDEHRDEIVRAFHSSFSILKKPVQQERLFLVNQYLKTIIARLSLASIEAMRTPSDKTELVVSQAISIMKRRIRESLTIADLAEETGYSRSHLSALFKLTTSYSPMNYFLRMKMNAAAKDLFFTESKISEIAEKYSVHDPYYFSRLFKKHMGMSPQAYRMLKIG